MAKTSAGEAWINSIIFFGGILAIMYIATGGDFSKVREIFSFAAFKRFLDMTH